jgi:hypothetical protein
MSRISLQTKVDKKLINKITPSTKNELNPEKTFYNLEKVINRDLEIYCKVSTKNKIKFCNADFTKAIGYTEKELLNLDYDLVYHPDMPRVIKILLNHRIKSNKDILVISKNMDNTGCYFWTKSYFKAQQNEYNLNIAFSVKSKPITREAKQEIDKLYAKLLKIEKHHDATIASKYLFGFLEEKGLSFSNYIEKITS